MTISKRKSLLITIFVIAWLSLFSYETLRYDYLNRLLGTKLPKFKFLFPPAGWIMFYHVGDVDVRVEVYGVRGEKMELIEPHRIFNNPWIGYDNIRRNILVSVLDPYDAPAFCHYLRRKFPEYEHFKIYEVITPSISEKPRKKIMKVAYEC